MCLSWLLLVLCLGLTGAKCSLFDRIWEFGRWEPEPRPVIHLEKQGGWACKLGGAESLGISQVGLIVLARLMESQIWHQFASSVGGGFKKELMASAGLKNNLFSKFSTTKINFYNQIKDH